MNITTTTSEDILKELYTRMYDIPFDNSAFQTINFILNASLTPERAYRSAGLRLQDRLNALKEAKFTAMKDDVKIRKLKASMGTLDDKFEIELAEIEISEIESNIPYREKLINDAIVEAGILHSFIQSCPKYTREDFESAERTHYEKRLLEDIRGVTGAVKSLSDMGVDLSSLNTNILIYKEKENDLLTR